MKVTHCFLDDEGETTWAYVEHNGRGCYWGAPTKTIPNFNEECGWATEENVNAVLEKIKEEGFNPATLPHIEDADPVMKQLWNNISESDNCMWFVDNEQSPGYEVWDEDFGLTKEEYIRRVDAEIEKYGLEDVITKNEDADTLYTCYGGLQTAFSEAKGNKMATIAKIYDVALDKEFRVLNTGNGVKPLAKFTDKGFFLYNSVLQEWFPNNTWFAELLTGKVVILEDDAA